MSDLLRRMQDTEDSQDRRLAELEASLRAQLAALRADSAASSSSWVWPFLALAALAVALAGGWVSNFRRLRKMHVL